MKALPKRKGNLVLIGVSFHVINCLNESPYDKEGKSVAALQFFKGEAASMKALPKRKGNLARGIRRSLADSRLNESHSEKEGK